MCKHICKTSNLLALFSEDIFAVKETQRYFCTILGYCLWAPHGKVTILTTSV